MMKLRDKPVVPTRKTKRKTIEHNLMYFIEDTDLGKVLNILSLLYEKYKGQKPKLRIDLEQMPYDDYPCMQACIEYTWVESDEEFDARVTKWEKDLNDWELWFSGNKTEIETEQTKRVERERKKKELKRQLKELEGEG